MSAPAHLFVWLGAMWDVSRAAFLAQPALYALWFAWIVLAAVAVGQALDRNGWIATAFAIGSVSCFAIACALPRPAMVALTSLGVSP